MCDHPNREAAMPIKGVLMNRADLNRLREAPAWGFICRVCRQEFDYGREVIFHVKRCQEKNDG